MSTEEKTLHESPLRGESEALAATFGEWYGCALPSNYGDTLAEWNAARSTAALYDTNFHAVFHLTGPDRVRYLNAVTTNDIKNLTEGRGNTGLLLNPQGHILAEIEAYALADKLLLITHALTAQRTFETLDRFIIMDDCTLEDASARFGSCAVEGPRAAAALEKLCGLELAALAEPSALAARIFGAECYVLQRPFAGAGPAAEIFTNPSHLHAIWEALLEAARAQGGSPTGYEALNALRLEAGIPWFGYDFDDRVIPHEAGLEMSHISYTKGCYTGQEIVERVRSRGHVNRRRVMLKFSGPEPPASGTVLLAAGKEVGHVTSGAFSPARQAAIGMGYVRREHAVPGSRLEFPGGTAEVIEFPAAAASPASCG